MDIFSPYGMILRSLINKKSKIRIPNFSISFFSKVVQWYIEHYSTKARTWHETSGFQDINDESVLYLTYFTERTILVPYICVCIGNTVVRCFCYDYHCFVITHLFTKSNTNCEHSRQNSLSSKDKYILGRF